MPLALEAAWQCVCPGDREARECVEGWGGQHVHAEEAGFCPIQWERKLQDSALASFLPCCGAHFLCSISMFRPLATSCGEWENSLYIGP